MLGSILPVILFFTAILGPALGSFFCAQIVRNSGLLRSKGVYGQRSECDECGHVLNAYDLVPLFSFLLLRGKCRYCGKRISAKLFLCEVLGLVLYSTLAIGLGYHLARDGIARDTFVNLVVHGSILTVLFYLATYDLLLMEVPARVTQLAAVYAVVVNVVFLLVHLMNPQLLPQVLLGGIDNLVMGIVAGAFFYLIIRATRNKGMGLGDLLIAIVIGLSLGWPHTVSAFYVMIFSASAVGLIMAASQRKLHGLKIPLVPFMTFGYIVALVFGADIFRLLFFSI